MLSRLAQWVRLWSYGLLTLICKPEDLSRTQQRRVRFFIIIIVVIKRCCRRSCCRCGREVLFAETLARWRWSRTPFPCVAFSHAYVPQIETSCRREAACTICPRPCDLDLWPFDPESGVRVTCDVGYLCAYCSLPRPLCSRLRPDVRDRQTDVTQTGVIQHHRLMPPPRGRGVIVEYYEYNIPPDYGA